MTYLYLTPEILRDAADLLSSSRDTADSRPRFICTAVDTVNYVAHTEMEQLLRNCGLTSFSGCLFTESFIPDLLECSAAYYYANAQSVRFMFLEFMALYLESEEENS